jgi:succinate-semialdehyde dehydrogenase/glutarate-semialdehyde dehydrogenase
VMAFAGITGLPFGGIGESGFGRIHGDQGLLEFVRCKATTTELFPIPGLSMVFGEPEAQLAQTKKTVETLYGGSMIDSATALLRRLKLR